MEYHVSVNGNDVNPGTEAAPFRTVAHGIGELSGGDILTIHNGVYYERLTIHNDTGNSIVIRSADHEQAVIDGARTDFLSLPSDMWGPPDEHGVQISTHPYPAGTSRGAFDHSPYTRLITYVSLDDLQAENQTFGPMLEGDLDPPGVEVKEPGGKPPRRPFVYMGPGLYQDPVDLHVHVRLTHTQHGAAGVPDYTGQEDARLVPLAVWTAPDPAVFIDDSDPVSLYNITIRNGGGRTVKIARSTGVTLDHVTILAGPYGLEIGEDCTRTHITNTRLDGGMPPWFFRSDKKDGYIDENDFNNELGGRTLKSLITCEGSSDGTTIEFSEFVNAHDLLLNGTNVTFTRNWLDNINDDGIFVGKRISDLIITTNVFQRCLSVLSVATDSAIGAVYFHRNLVDLRRPTVGRRPPPDPTLIPPEAAGVFRYGQLFKSNYADPEVNVFQNTVLVVDQEGHYSYNLFRREPEYTTMRRAYNNIFLAINRTERFDKPVSYIPPPTDQAEMNGNCYFRIGLDTADLLASDGDTYVDIETWKLTTLFAESAVVHPPGYEDGSIDDNPKLRRYWLPLEFPVIEDLRLAELDPAGDGGVPLEDRLLEIDGSEGAETNHIGCYPFDAPPLTVGVDGRRVFPSNPLAPPPGDFG